mgnify:CR=1 FL=1|tara:strand:+ start:242 stop:571 length:330 start_codon:yes stop_codon:yes gene_type:complete
MMEPHHIFDKIAKMPRPRNDGLDNDKMVEDILSKIEDATAHMVKHPSGNEEVRGQIRRYHIANKDDRLGKYSMPGDEKYMRAKPEWPLVMALGTIKGPGGVAKFKRRIR